MSMPQFPPPNPEMTTDQALNMILSSIALEELALSHIINAEGEKIQYVLKNPVNGTCPATTADILAVNKSVSGLLEMVMQNQLLLKNKMEKVLEYLPIPPRPDPPCPPVPPKAPCVNLPCTPSPLPNQTICFEAVPGCYQKDCAVLWKEDCSCERIAVKAASCDRIHLPRTGRFFVEIAVEFCVCHSVKEIVALELLIECAEKQPVSKLFYLVVPGCGSVLCGSGVVQMPCSCSPCYGVVKLRSPESIQIKQGYISFTPA